eukprot:CAMPEP_0117649576 /NCGR_PEP_ID=MMETSP0804-20121206/1049_1 /TAXON_ID=1074897 /ORGANISM="Tetraselmis astigmatica, Strain CCMP880" /LENGTH=150 /DNA_ID=CAMNT_0005455329 /DNA_START=471 /DNA_END=926 /DNA_ORIENTATION=-
MRCPHNTKYQLQNTIWHMEAHGSKRASLRVWLPTPPIATPAKFVRDCGQHQAHVHEEAIAGGVAGGLETFAARWGIANVGAEVNGTDVPWKPDNKEFMAWSSNNYKGWYSIVVVAMVNGFYMFVDHAEVGHPRGPADRMSDSTATQLSNF